MLCRLGGSRAEKSLAFSRSSWTDVWCRCLSVWSCFDWAYFSASVVSLYKYISVYYLCHLEMSRSWTGISASSLPFMLYETLKIGEVRDESPWFASYIWYLCVYKKILCIEWRQSIKNLEMCLVHSLCGYCCEASQRTGNWLVRS
jgi:hypothetical protein